MKNLTQWYLVVLFLSLYFFGCSLKKRVTTSVYGSHQNTTILSEPKCDSCLESFNYKFSARLQQSLKLEPLNYAKDTFHFRFWRVSQAIDIWTTDYKNFGGVVTSFYEKYKKLKVGEKPYEGETKTVKQQHVLDSNKAKQAFDLILKYDLLNIPDCMQIKEWRWGFDGFSYIIETSTPLNYSLKTYWSPKAQKESVVEAKNILAFEKSLDTILGLDKLGDEFKSNVPSGSYVISGTIIHFQKF